MNIYPAYSGWSESTITYNTWASNQYSPVMSGYAIIDPNAVADTSSVRFPAVAYGGRPRPMTFDVTSAFKKATASGINDDTEFAFLTALGEVSGSYAYVIFASSEYTNASYRPYIKVTIEDIPTLELKSKTEPVYPSDKFELTFSNDISDATIKVNGSKVSETDIDISGTDLTFDYDYAPFKTYDVEVEVTDAFGQKFAKMYNFTIDAKMLNEQGLISAAYFVSNEYSQLLTGRGMSIYSPSLHAIIYRAPLPTLTGIEKLDSFEFKFWLAPPKNVDKSSKITVYQCATDDLGDLSVLKLSDVSEYIDSQYELGHPSFDEHVAWNENDLANYDAYVSSAYRINATQYAQQLIDAGKSDIYFIVTATETLQFMGDNNYMESDISAVCKTAVYSVINSNPSFDISAKDIVLSGNTLSKAAFSLKTNLPASFASNIELVDENGTKVDSASFSCDGGDVEINSAVTLESGSAYSLVIKAGAQDSYGNELASDLVVQSFVANPSVQFSEDAAGRHELYTDNANNRMEYIYINPDFGGMTFTVDIKNRGTSVSGYPKTIKSTLGGKIEEIVSLNSGEYDISIVPMGASEGWTHFFYIFDTDTLNSLWNIMTSSDGSAIQSKWALLTDAFDISKSPETNLTVLCNVLSANAKSFGERDAANLKKFMVHLASCELFAQLNQCAFASVGEAKAMIEATFPQIEAVDSAAYASISAEWAELGSRITQEYQKMADTVFTASDEAAKLIMCIGALKSQHILDKLNALNHTSLIYGFVTEDVNAQHLGIADLIDDYKALDSTSSVDSALQGKGFATVSALRTAFSAAIDLAKTETPHTSPSQKPSYSSGGGNGGFGVIAANPSLIPETSVPETGLVLPFADVANHTWAHSAIASLHSKGIIAGRGDGSFAPDDKVTRAEFAKMLVLALGIEAKSTDIAFADVASNDWFASYALTAAANGIVLGTDGAFMPNACITRQDAAVMIYRAAALADGTMPVFTDADSIASYARDAIASLCAAGIIKGMEDGSFAPISSLTRAQAAVMLSRIMEV
ncbi:MAG: hypothetical protein E7395_04810 [Ruminococcaceae bacterium]|nr:hypothetical protein [Oscillospiraceae bacterium]